MKQIIKKILAGIICFAMIVGILPVMQKPVEVKADEEKTIVCLGTEAIANPKVPESEEDEWTGSYVIYGDNFYYNGQYFGNCRVLSKDTTDFSAGKNESEKKHTMLLDQIWSHNNYSIYHRDFDEEHEPWSDYETSELKKNINQYTDDNLALKDPEKKAIVVSTKLERAEGDSDFGEFVPLTGDRFFVLDIAEARRESYGYYDGDKSRARIKFTRNFSTTDTWVLRTAADHVDGVIGNRYCKEFDTNYGVYVVMEDGSFFRSSLQKYAEEYVWNEKKNEFHYVYKWQPEYFSVSRAFNIDLDYVLFSSLFSGEAGEYGAVYKLTILDDDLTIKLSDRPTVSGNTAMIPYTITGAHFNEATQVSVLVLDKEYTKRNTNNAVIKQYGKLNVDNFLTSGAGTFTFNEDVDLKNDYIYIIAEDVNYETTDFASTPFKLEFEDFNGPDKTITGLGTGMIGKPKPLDPELGPYRWIGSYVYYGLNNVSESNPGESVRYRVLDPDTTVFSAAETGDEKTHTMFLDCDKTLYNQLFDNDGIANVSGHNPNEWAISDLRASLNDDFLAKSFSKVESNGIAFSTKQERADGDGDGYTTRTMYYGSGKEEIYSYTFDFSPLSKEKIFVLDIAELFNPSYGYDPKAEGTDTRWKNGSGYNWWTRSALLDTVNKVGLVKYTTQIGTWGVNENDYDGLGVSPAFNIKRDSILFSSLLSGTAGSPEAEYKLTIMDDDLSITLKRAEEIVDGTWEFSYAINGPSASKANRVSVLLLNSEYEPGKTVTAGTNEAGVPNYTYLQLDTKIPDAYNGTVYGSGTVMLPDEYKGLVMGTDYFAYILAEDVVDPLFEELTLTDYASAPVKVEKTYDVNVTFKVKNGSWDDGTIEDKTVVLSGVAGDPLKLIDRDIPVVGTNPNENFKAGNWDVTPDTDTEITDDITYTYTYEKITKKISGLGTGSIGYPSEAVGSDAIWLGDYVYYGKYDGINPTRYRVLYPRTQSFGVENGSIFLDCDSVLYIMPFDSDGIANEEGYNPNDWVVSDIKDSLNGADFLDKEGNFSAAEKFAIAGSTKNSGYSSTYLDWASLSGEKIFLLDVDEVTNDGYGYRLATASSDGRIKRYLKDYCNWWLRSAHNSSTDKAGSVDGFYGSCTSEYINDTSYGVSPAFNIRLSSVIFSSLVKFLGNRSEYKLTIKDSDLNIATTSGKKVTIKEDNNTVTVPYTITDNSNTSTPTQVSVVITDGTWTDGGWSNGAKVLQYGMIDEISGTVSGNTIIGTGRFKLDDSITGTWGTDYHVYILAEDVKFGTALTDYASIPFELPEPVNRINNDSIGDVNSDGQVNAKDVTALRRYLAEGRNVTVNLANSDINGDGIVNPKDVTILRRFLAGGWGIVLDEY